MKFTMPKLTAVRGLILGLVVLVFGQTGARADCGDHVILGGAEAQARAAQSSHAREHRGFPGRPSNKPCSGPTCRKQSPMAPAIPLEVSKRLVDQPIWIACLETGEANGLSGLFPSSVEATLSCGHPNGVFHPPRV